MKWKIALVLLVLLLIGAGYVSVRYYPYVFAKSVKGEIIGVEKVNPGPAVITQDMPSASQLFSFAVAIKQDDGEIFTASSEDRRWAVAHQGLCVEARFFPYPPWNLARGGTYYGARLERLYECPKNQGAKPASPPVTNASPVAPKKKD
jgi:hypothetical protein